MRVKHYNVNQQRGASIVELMVGITIGLFLLAGTVTVFGRLSNMNAENIQSIRLNQQLRHAMSSISREIQRAGYVMAWDGSDVDGSGHANLADMELDAINSFGPITLRNADDSSCATDTDGDSINDSFTNCSCILFSYDFDQDGTLDNDEMRGFKLNNGAIQKRTGGGTHQCAFDSTNSTWEGMTDSHVNVTTLTFDIAYVSTSGTGKDATIYDLSADTTTLGSACPSSTNCWERRKVEIAIGAELNDDATTKLEIRNEVKIKNDFFNTP